MVPPVYDRETVPLEDPRHTRGVQEDCGGHVEHHMWTASSKCYITEHSGNCKKVCAGCGT